MDKKSLQKIYRFSEVVSQPKDEQHFLNIPFDGQWLTLHRGKLTLTEIELLSSLFLAKETPAVNQQEHLWYGFLFESQNLDDVNGTFRVIQFKLLQETPPETKKEWLEAFTSMFSQVTDAFFIDDTYGIVVEEKNKNNYSLEELTGILMTLESDFMVKTKAFLGSFFTISQGFPRFFQEEKNIFLTEYPLIKAEAAFSLSQVALHYFTTESVNNSLIMQVFRKKLSIDTEMKEIITALWKNQGNISSAAKELFMHRNTLQYRIEKFHEQTNLSLKSMDDLVLSYLLVI